MIVLRGLIVIVVSVVAVLALLVATDIVSYSSMVYGPASECNGCYAISVSFMDRIGYTFGGPTPGPYIPLTETPWTD